MVTGVLTDSSGNYTFPSLSPATCLVSFHDPRNGYADQWWNNQPSMGAATPVVVPGSTSGINAALLPSGTH